MSEGKTSAIEAAFDRFLAEYREVGGFRYPGRVDATDPAAYVGPSYWSEHDVAYRLAHQLEHEVPGCVHLELPLAGYTRSDLEEGEANSRIDISLSDMSGFEADDAAAERFKALQYDAFIEVKWLYKGWWGSEWEMDAHGRVDGVRRDLAALRRHLELGRCQVAAMLIVDEECFFEHHFEEDWPSEILRLVASPLELKRRGLDDEIVDAELDRIEELSKLDKAKLEKKRAGQEKDRDQAQQLLADRDNLERNVKTLRVGAFDLAVAAGREKEDVELLELLKARASGEKGKSWRTREEIVFAAYEQAKEARAKRFVWQPGDVEITPPDEVIDPDEAIQFDLSPELDAAVRKALKARNERARKLQEEKQSREEEQ